MSELPTTGGRPGDRSLSQPPAAGRRAGDRSLSQPPAAGRRAGDAALDLVFNPESLRQLTGAARAGHLRYKPGTGLTAALLDADGAAVGWLRVVNDGGTDKLANARRRAERRGLAVHAIPEPVADQSAATTVPEPGADQSETTTVPEPGADQSEATTVPEPGASEERGARRVEGPPRLSQNVTFWGPVLADPGLAKALDEVGDSLAATWRILRYNPLRRLVVKAHTADGTPVAGRLTHGRQDHLREAAARISRQVPTVARVHDDSLPESSRITWWQWCGGGDLAQHPSPGAAREAGRVTAMLHQVVPPPVDGVRGQVGSQLEANVALLTEVDGGLGRRLGAAARRLLPRLYCGGAAVTCHGDLSADQFFLKGTRVRLGDLDRVTAGPAAFDLGSFAATSPELFDDFVAGYRSLSPASPRHEEHVGSKGRPSLQDDLDLPELAAWTAYAHAIRVLEPFRTADPRWRELIAARIDTVEETLCSR